MQREYELMLLTDTELEDTARTAILDRVKDIVTTGKGTWVSTDEWGRRKMAYEINKKPEATYHLLQFDCDSDTLDEVTRVLRITDGVMRQLAVNRVPPLPEGVTLEVWSEEDAERGERGGRGRGRGRDRGGRG